MVSSHLIWAYDPHTKMYRKTDMYAGLRTLKTHPDIVMYKLRLCYNRLTLFYRTPVWAIDAVQEFKEAHVSRLPIHFDTGNGVFVEPITKEPNFVWAYPWIEDGVFRVIRADIPPSLYQKYEKEENNV